LVSGFKFQVSGSLFLEANKLKLETLNLKP